MSLNIEIAANTNILLAPSSSRVFEVPIWTCLALFTYGIVFKSLLTYSHIWISLVTGCLISLVCYISLISLISLIIARVRLVASCLVSLVGLVIVIRLASARD